MDREKFVRIYAQSFKQVVQLDKGKTHEVKRFESQWKTVSWIIIAALVVGGCNLIYALVELISL